MPNPVAATSRIATTAAPARNGGRGVGSALCAPSRLPGLLDWVILGPPIGRLMRGGEFCSGNVRDPCAIGRKWGVVPAQGFPQPADAGWSGEGRCAGLEYLVRRGREDDRTTDPKPLHAVSARNGWRGRDRRQGVSGQMDDRAEDAVFGCGRGGRLRLGRGIGRTKPDGADDRLGGRPAGRRPAMHVSEQNDQLDGEREQRAPRPKSKVRPNPAH